MAIKQMIQNQLDKKAEAEHQEVVRLRWKKAMLEKAIAEKKSTQKCGNVK